MVRRAFGLVGRGFAGLWRWLDAVRRTVFNLLFLFIIAVLIALVWRPTPTVPEGAALLVRPNGNLVEQVTLDDPLGLRLGDAAIAQVALRDVLEAVQAARDDDRIKALVIETDGLNQAGLSKLSELRAAIAAFRDSGKPVLARGERFTQGQYYLASAADEIHLAPDGFLLVRGLARYVTYFKGALDALGVRVHVFRAGEYKSFSEPFTRTDMSEEDREVTRDLLDGLWSVFRDDVAAARRIAPEALDRYVTDYAAVLEASGGDAARAALEAGLVDRFSTRDQWRALLMERVGPDKEGKDFRRVTTGAYLANIRAARAREGDRVAVLVAQGPIVDGSGTRGSVGGDSFARLVREVREDERVKALVVRIDSPGGSAWASELIRRELELTREAGKPVIASMSSTAASGGYWIAAGANEIWAAPTTLTGSIGVFAMFPEFSRPLERMGVTMDGVETAPLAGALDPRRPLDPEAAAALQLGIDHGYRRFLEVVAEARGMKVGEVDAVAQGRVWMGDTAANLGLVDQLGGLDAAVGAAVARAGLERYELVWPETGLTPGQRLLRRLGDLAGAGLPDAGFARSPLGLMLAALQAETQALLQWNDPRHTYAHCLCEGP